MAAHQDYLPFAFFEDTIVPFSDAKISIATNGLQYGIAIFGGIKGYLQNDGSIGIFRLEDHLQRMERSAKILRFPYEFRADQIKQTFVELTKKNKPTSDVYYRPFIYRSDTALSPSISGDYSFSLHLLAVGDYFDKSRGMKVSVSSWVRNSDNALPPRTKASGGYVNAALAMHDAKTAGYDAAIMLDGEGQVGEGAVMNLFMVRDGVLYTPQVTADILEGITRRSVIELAEQAGIKTAERPIDRTELYIADEVFFSGTATELSWVEQVDGVSISTAPGKVFSEIQKRFQQATHDPKHQWLTIVPRSKS